MSFSHLLAAFVGLVIGWTVVCLIVNGKIADLRRYIFDLETELRARRLGEGK